MKTLFRLSLFILFMVAGMWLMLSLAWQPEKFEPGSISSARLQMGPLAVTVTERVFIDTSRPTQANGDYEGADSRTLPGGIWSPTDTGSGPYPLLIYSHGFASSREGGAYLARHMASLGYVVVAVDYPLTNMKAPGGPLVKDVVNQAQDASFLIDEMLALSQDSHSAFYGMIDEQRIGAFGLSLGGFTTELLTFHPEWGDPRLNAALSIAGPTYMLAPAFFAHRPNIPFMMLAGDIDAIVPWAANAQPVPDKMPGAELVTLRDASHVGFAGPAAYMRWMNNPDSLGCKIVLANIADDMDKPWFDLIGSPGQGVLNYAQVEICQQAELPPAMNVLRQHMITKVVVSSFFERAFSSSVVEKKAADHYLRQQMTEELPDVSYEVNMGGHYQPDNQIDESFTI
ncbi:MAG: alpha/beta hydrolase family protein [Parahaliea sp.]